MPDCARAPVWGVQSSDPPVGGNGGNATATSWDREDGTLSGPNCFPKGQSRLLTTQITQTHANTMGHDSEHVKRTSPHLSALATGGRSWLVAGIVPGIERHPLKKLSFNEEVLLKLLHRWRDEAVKAGSTGTRSGLCFVIRSRLPTRAVPFGTRRQLTPVRAFDSIWSRGERESSESTDSSYSEAG